MALDPRIADENPSFLARLWNRFLKHKGYLEKLGVLSVILAAAQYFFTYGQRVEERQNKDWEVIRAVQVLHMDQNKKALKGNLGVLEPLQRLTRDCERQSQSWGFLFSYFDRDCLRLPSLTLEFVELGEASLRYANLRQGSFHCSNLQGADLVGANLTDKWLGGANLTGADFSGAKFRDGRYAKNQFWFSDLTGATFSESTDIDPEALLCGCVRDGVTIQIKGMVEAKSSKFREVQEKLRGQTCPSQVCAGVFVETISDADKAQAYKLPKHCVL